MKKETVIYIVVINEDGMYSVWWESKEIPKGWEYAQFKGSKQDCLNHIEEVWTSMRPLGIHNKED